MATRIFASDVARYFRVGGDRGGVTGFDFLLSFALFAVGHLVGLWVGIAMFVGALIGWAWGVPHFSALAASAEPMAQLAQRTWSHQVRFVGAGTIGVAAVWTLAKLVKPVIAGLRSAMAASRARAAGNAALLPRTEQDIPIGYVALVSLVCMVPIGVLIANFSAGSGLGDHMFFMVVSALIYIALMSFFVSAVCGYMAGLIGSSNSPLSGIGILVVIGAALLLVPGIRSGLPAGSGSAGGLRAVRHGGGVRGGGHRQQQPAGSEDRPARRCHAVEAAGGAGHRRHRRRRDHSADPRSAQPCLRFRRRARPAPRAPACRRRRRA